MIAVRSRRSLAPPQHARFHLLIIHSFRGVLGGTIHRDLWMVGSEAKRGGARDVSLMS